MLFAAGRIPRAEDLSKFCEDAERVQGQATVVLCDANRDVDAYDELLSGLRSRGRRVVVVGTQYRASANSDGGGYLRIEAPARLSEPEREQLVSLLQGYLRADIDDIRRINDYHFLAFLYRFLPASRPRLGSGLGAEARTAVQQLEARGSEAVAVAPMSQLHQQLIEKGYISEYRVVFQGAQVDALEDNQGAAGKLIDTIMLAGSLGCAIPVDLLMRSITPEYGRVDSELMSRLFRDLDLCRWESADPEGNEWLIQPRLTLEAELICRRRLGNAQSEAMLLSELIGSVRQGLDNNQEIRFLLDLLQQIGTNGPRGPRYRIAYIDFARKLTELRRRFNVVDARLILQESAFRRAAVRESGVDGVERFELLEEARDAVQSALDEIDNGKLTASGRTRRNLLVERAAIYGFLANRQAELMQDANDIWSAYKTAKIAVQQAVSVSDNYYPYDVGLWIPADLLKSGLLAVTQQAELVADLYSTLDQVESRSLSPGQRERFERRRMSVGMALEDHELTESAYLELECIDSTAGYFLRAREIGPNLDAESIEIESSHELGCASSAADFLAKRFDRIKDDPRCLWLLLENMWIAELGRRPLRGERQPLPIGEAQRRLLKVVQALNEAAGESSRHETRYLEATLTWIAGGYPEARDIYRQIDSETDHIYRGRVLRRHQVSNPDGSPKAFDGRVESRPDIGSRRLYIRVSELGQMIPILPSDFPSEDIQYGRTILGFGIAFNFIGPIATMIRQ